MELYMCYMGANASLMQRRALAKIVQCESSCSCSLRNSLCSCHWRSPLEARQCRYVFLASQEAALILLVLYEWTLLCLCRGECSLHSCNVGTLQFFEHFALFLPCESTLIFWWKGSISLRSCQGKHFTLFVWCKSTSFRSCQSLPLWLTAL